MYAVYNKTILVNASLWIIIPTNYYTFAFTAQKTRSGNVV